MRIKEATSPGPASLACDTDVDTDKLAPASTHSSHAMLDAASRHGYSASLVSEPQSLHERIPPTTDYSNTYGPTKATSLPSAVLLPLLVAAAAPTRASSIRSFSVEIKVSSASASDSLLLLMWILASLVATSLTFGRVVGSQRARLAMDQAATRPGCYTTRPLHDQAATQPGR